MSLASDNVIDGLEGRTLAYAISTTEIEIDLEADFAEDYSREMHYYLDSDVVAYFKFSPTTGLTLTIDPDARTDDSGVNTAHITPRLTPERKQRVMIPKIRVNGETKYAKYLYVEGAGPGVLRVSLAAQH